MSASIPLTARLGLAMALVTLAAAGAALAAALAVKDAAAQSITTAPVNFGSVILDGTDKLVTGSTAAWVVDAADSAEGWNVTVAAGDFADGAGHTIPVHNLEIRLPDDNIVPVSGEGAMPVSTQPDFTPLSGDGLKIASAEAGAGSGVYNLTPEFQLTVPAETYAGSYTAALTVAVNTGP